MEVPSSKKNIAGRNLMEYPCPPWNVDHVQAGRFRDFQSATYCMFFFVESGQLRLPTKEGFPFPPVPLVWDSKDVLLCHNENVSVPKRNVQDSFSRFFKQKHTRSPCSRSEGFLKNQVHLFDIHCISHTLKQTVHPDAPKPSPLRGLQTFEWRLQTCVLGFSSKFAEHISDSLLD